jgi:hypothetical protein
MTRWIRNACVFMVFFTFVSAAFAPANLPAAEPSPPHHQTPVLSGTFHPGMQALGQEIAGGGLAGAGVGQSINPVVLRNVLIGLAFAGLWLFSAMNQSN